MSSSRKFLRILSLFLLFFGLALPCFALSPEARKWNHVPMGIDFAGGQYTYTSADIFFDPTLSLENVKLEMHTWGGAYIHAFELLDKSARIEINQAYQRGTWTGLLDGKPASATRSGWSDTFVRFAANLYGAPPLSGEEFAAYRSKIEDETIVGLGLVVRLPTGHYLEDKLVNLSENRFVFRPQVGVVHTFGRWTTEVNGEVAFHTENDEFFDGNKLEQDPMYRATVHALRTFSPGQWVGMGFGYEFGGENTLNGVDQNDKKKNIGWAFAYRHPINRQIGIKVRYIGIRAKELTGFDSEELMVSLAYAW